MSARLRAVQRGVDACGIGPSRAPPRTGAADRGDFTPVGLAADRVDESAPAEHRLARTGVHVRGSSGTGCRLDDFLGPEYMSAFSVICSAGSICRGQRKLAACDSKVAANRAK